jgi:hypothetical protein
MNDGSTVGCNSPRWSRLVPAVVLALLLLAVAGGVYRKSSQAVAPPIYDAMQYYAKAALVWQALGTGKLVNPLNVAPTERPPGVIVLSGPTGFSPDFRAFFFRATFFPIILFIAACWLVAHERLRDPRAGWLIASACAALVALPMFYHFERSDILPVPASWGLVDGFLAGVASMATALLLLGARRQSLAVTAGGALTGAFTLIIKPSALFVIPVILWAWFIELLIVHWPVRRAWRQDSRFRAYALGSCSTILLVVGLMTFVCFRSRYLSNDTLSFFANSQRILREMYRGTSLAKLILPQVHPWLGWHWVILWGVIVALALVGAVVRGARLRMETEDVRFFAALVAFGGGVIWWIWVAGPSEVRYVLPFVLVFIVITLPGILLRVASLPTWARCPWCVAMVAPAVLLTLLLWTDQPAIFLQRLLGVGLATGQFREEVRIGSSVVDEAQTLKRDLTVYVTETDGSQAVVEAVGAYHHLIAPKDKFFRTLCPIDWRRPPLIRRHDLLSADYVLFRPIDDAKEMRRWAVAERIDGFEAETRAIRAWLTGAGTADGLEVTYSGSLRLVKIVDLGAADRSFGLFVGQHRWRNLFSSENSAPVQAGEREIRRAATTAAVGTRRVEFEGKFRLDGAILKHAGNVLQMELVWEDLGAEPANWWVAVHVLDRRGKIISQADYPIHASARTRLAWTDRVMWSKEQLRGADRVGVGVYRPNVGALKADRGELDWDKTRLLIALPR